MVKQIGGIFGRSFFGPINEHMQVVRESLELLPRLLEAYLAGRYDEVEEVARLLQEAEHKADRTKQEIRSLVSPSFITSTERADMLLLTNLQDAVADGCESVAKLLVLRQRPVPEDLRQPFSALTLRVVRTGFKVSDITAQLHTLDHQAAPPEPKVFLPEIDEVHGLEHEADETEHATLRRLFELEDSLDPVSVVFLWNLATRLGKIADSAENAADCLRRFVGRR